MVCTNFVVIQRLAHSGRGTKGVVTGRGLTAVLDLKLKLKLELEPEPGKLLVLVLMLTGVVIEARLAGADTGEAGSDDMAEG